MSTVAVLTHGPSLRFASPASHFSSRRHPRQSFAASNRRLSASSGETKLGKLPHLFKSSTSRIRNFQQGDAETYKAARSRDAVEGQDEVAEQVFGNRESRTTGTGSSFLAKIAIALGIAATITLASVGFKQLMHGSSHGVPYLAHDSSAPILTASSAGFNFKVFGNTIVLPEYPSGWIYFWLLMAAGCGLFISEEALNIWIGISLARMLSLDGTWQSFVESFSRNAPYIISTVLWVYWGVCISDLIPFYLGKLFRQSGASHDVCSKLGIGKEKAMDITRVVQRYGNLVGFVERFSLGVRNPTAFLAGAMDISPECFFAGVCCGGLITLPVQVIKFVCKIYSVIYIGNANNHTGLATMEAVLNQPLSYNKAT